MNKIIKDENCLFCKTILPNYINITGSSRSYFTECKACKIRYGINYISLYKYIVQNNKYIIGIN